MSAGDIGIPKSAADKSRSVGEGIGQAETGEQARVEEGLEADDLAAAHDEQLAERVREALDATADVTEQKMFGGLAFLVRGHMVCGVVHDDLMLRLGPEGAEAAVRRPHVRPMDFTGRPMRSTVYVGAPGVVGEALDDGVLTAAAFADRLPPKKPATRRRRG